MNNPRRHAPGMNTLHGQAKDRNNWKKSVAIRKGLINQAQALNIKLNRPHEMKISELQELVDKHYESGGKHASRKKRKKTRDQPQARNQT